MSWGEVKEIKTRYFVLYPIVLGESVYSKNRFVLVSAKEDFLHHFFFLSFLFDRYKSVHWHSRPPHTNPFTFLECVGGYRQSLREWIETLGTTVTTCEGKQNFIWWVVPDSFPYLLFVMVCQGSTVANTAYSVNRVVSIKEEIRFRKFFLFCTTSFLDHPIVLTYQYPYACGPVSKGWNELWTTSGWDILIQPVVRKWLHL